VSTLTKCVNKDLQTLRAVAEDKVEFAGSRWKCNNKISENHQYGIQDNFDKTTLLI